MQRNYRLGLKCALGVLVLGSLAAAAVMQYPVGTAESAKPTSGVASLQAAPPHRHFMTAKMEMEAIGPDAFAQEHQALLATPEGRAQFATLRDAVEKEQKARLEQKKQPDASAKKPL